MLLRALLAFIALPGVVAFLAPPCIANADPWRGAPWLPGALVMAVGTFIVLWCVRDFYVSGKGTLAPWDPPKSLVVVGLYRIVRNPMYVGVIVVIVGWALFLASRVVGLYALAIAVAFHIRVLVYEEPRQAAVFGDEWEHYKKRVPRWVPRFKPSRGGRQP